MEEWARRQTMTKTIEEQIEDAKDDLVCATAQRRGGVSERMAAAIQRGRARAEARLATLEAVRDGRMVAVYATVCVNSDGGWGAHGAWDIDSASDDARVAAMHEDGDAVTLMRGYAHVPSTQVHEVEADSEVPS